MGSFRSIDLRGVLSQKVVCSDDLEVGAPLTVCNGPDR